MCKIPQIHALILVPIGVVSDVNLLGHWGVSGLATSYPPHQTDPLRDDQTLGHLPFRTLWQPYGFISLWILLMINLCNLDYSDCCPHLYCYIHSVSTDVPSSLFQVLLVKLGKFLVIIGNLHVVIGNLHRTWTKPFI